MSSEIKMNILKGSGFISVCVHSSDEKQGDEVHIENFAFLTAAVTTEPHSHHVLDQKDTTGQRGRAASGEVGIPHSDINYCGE